MSTPNRVQMIVFFRYPHVTKSVAPELTFFSITKVYIIAYYFTNTILSAFIDWLIIILDIIVGAQSTRYND